MYNIHHNIWDIPSDEIQFSINVYGVTDMGLVERTRRPILSVGHDLTFPAYTFVIHYN